MVFQFPFSVAITKTWFSDFLSSMVHGGYRFPLLVGCILVFPSHGYYLESVFHLLWVFLGLGFPKSSEVFAIPSMATNQQARLH